MAAGTQDPALTNDANFRLTAEGLFPQKKLLPAFLAVTPTLFRKFCQ